jgi:ribosomal protein S18 acetylase RimI-like enzyme
VLALPVALPSAADAAAASAAATAAASAAATAGVVASAAAAAGVAARACTWRHSSIEAVCDVAEPWAHGTVLKATRYADYYEYNVVRVEDDPPMTADALIAFADVELAELGHLRMEFDLVAAGDHLRAGFEARGWHAQRLAWMRHEAAWPPDAPTVEVEQVDYDAAHELRLAWHDDETPELDPRGYFRQARDIALRRGAQAFTVREAGQPVAFVELARNGPGAEVTNAYVLPAHRGRGLGSALIRAAAEAAGDVRDLWISADDEDRPKRLYRRLGFHAVWAAIEFLRLPQARGSREAA